ncbi:MAG: TonB family protein [Spirosomataceae bacterium]
MKTPITPAYNTLDDIVFAHRNRLYGAYDLRQVYPKTLRNALLIGIGIFLSLLLLPSIYSQLHPKEDVPYTKEVAFEKVTFEKKEEKPLPKLEKPKEIPKMAAVRFRVPEVIDNPPIEELPPPTEALEKANPGQETIKGIEEVAVVAPPETSQAEKATHPVEVESTVPEAFITVEVNPEYVGGMAAFRDFLSKNLRYPNAAQQSNVQGRVYINFVVEADGSLSNINVLRGIGFGCDEEAIRVMKLMPKWKPGKQSGRAVTGKVQYSNCICVGVTPTSSRQESKN